MVFLEQYLGGGYFAAYLKTAMKMRSPSGLVIWRQPVLTRALWPTAAPCDPVRPVASRTLRQREPSYALSSRQG